MMPQKLAPKGAFRHFWKFKVVSKNMVLNGAFEIVDVSNRAEINPQSWESLGSLDPDLEERKIKNSLVEKYQGRTKVTLPSYLLPEILPNSRIIYQHYLALRFPPPLTMVSAKYVVKISAPLPFK